MNLGYILVRTLYFVFRLIPLDFNHSIARVFAFIIQHIIRYRLSTVRANLQIARPELGENDLKSTIKEVYFNFSCLWIEVIQSSRLTEEYIQRHIRVYGWEAVANAQQAGKGIIFVTGHLGNFEWLGYYVAARGPKLNAVMKRVKNPKINDYIEKSRNSFGVRLIHMPGALRKCLRALQRGENIGLVTDQDARQKGIFIDFFGQPSSTAPGAAILHLQTGAPMVFCTGIRRRWGDFDLYFENVPKPTDSEDHERAVFEITQTHTYILQKWIEKHPGQYFWTHKRWKTVPNNTELVAYQSQKNRYSKVHPRKT